MDIQKLKKEIELEKKISAKLSKKSFYHFCKDYWHIIEPETPFKDGWHIRVICEHLQELSYFRIKNLMVNIPPRHMKSIIFNVMFPAWVWIERPHLKFLFAASSSSLATRDSLKCRQVITSKKYQDSFKISWSLQDDQNQKTIYQNSKGGVRKAIGVNTTVTGEGGDFLFIDDPMDANNAMSELERENVVYWHDNVFYSRYNDPKKHARAIIMQRLHEDDLCGHILKKYDYERIIMPARYDDSIEIKSKTSLGFKDWRKDGELLWPERFDEDSLKELENALEGEANAQMQQDPKPKKGGLFPRDQWKRYISVPSTIEGIYQFIDCAQKPGVTNDYSVIATWAKTHNSFYLLDLWRDKVAAPVLEKIVMQYYNKWRATDVIIEDKSAGSSLIQYLLSETTIPVTPYNPLRKDKTVRAIAATPMLTSGKLYIPASAPWIKDFLNEHERFPKAKNDDTVDTTSMMVEYFSSRTQNKPRVRQL